jgi:hypothetical protein
LVVGAGLIAALAILTGLLAAGSDGGRRAVNVAGTTTTTAAHSSATAYSSGLIPGDRAFEADLAVVDGDDAVLITLDGTELGRGRRGDWYPSNPDRGVDLVPVEGGLTINEAPPRPDPVPGCDAIHFDGDLWAAVCGSEAEPGEIRIMAADNTTRLLTGPVNPYGHWRYALPSPDGRWVLAQWSGECEVPVAYLFPAAGGRGHPVAGPDAETIAIGWTPDARAIVGFMPGACGEGNEPGTYLLDPTTLERHRIHPSYEAAPVIPGA